VGGVSVQELNALELELLFMMGWKLVCEEEALQRYYVNLVLQSSVFRIQERQRKKKKRKSVGVKRRLGEAGRTMKEKSEWEKLLETLD